MTQAESARHFYARISGVYDALADASEHEPVSLRLEARSSFDFEAITDELVAHAVPIDLRALKTLKGSPLALDIYSWLTYRMSYLRKPCLIPWEALQTQFGADYGRLRDFKRRFVGHLGTFCRFIRRHAQASSRQVC